MKYRILAFLLSVVGAIGQNIATVNRDRTYYPETYGAKPGDSNDDKTGLQNAINAAYTAGGGIVKLRAGVWEVSPLATGYGLLLKTGVTLEGEGDGTVIRFKSSTASAEPFEGIAPFGYNSVTAAYTAHEISIRNLKLECDGYLYSADNDHQYAHGLLGLVYTPKATVTNVTFGNVCYHQIEIQGSKNITISDCTFVGQTESSRIQIDTVGGSAGQRASVPNTYTADGVTIQNCRFAARNADGLTVSGSNFWMFELGHTSSATLIRNVSIIGCEFGCVYDADSTGTTYYGITSDSGSAGVFSRMENVRISGCRFLGNGTGNYTPIYMVISTTEDPSVDGFLVENNYFGAGVDCAGVKHAGGFLRCMLFGANTSGQGMNGGTTTSTDYSLRKNISVLNNRFFPRLVQGLGAHTSGYCDVVNVSAVLNATVEGNAIYYPPYAGAVSSANTGTDVLTVSTQHGLEIGDPILFNTISGLAFESATVLDSTTYYVSEIVTVTTFKVSATLGGASVNVTTSGTANWAPYLPTAGITTQCGFVLGQIANCSVRDNLVHYEHNTALASNLTYSYLFDFSGIETLGSTIGGGVEIINNRCMDVGSGDCQQGFKIYNGASTTTKYVKGRFAQNTVQGTFSTGTSLTGFPWWADSGTYTPTASAASNTTATPTVAQWQRNGDVVTVSGSVTLDATAGGAASFEATLPLASNFTQIYDAGGTAATGAVTENPAAISGVTANDTVKFDWVAVDTTSRVWYYTFTYQLK